MTETLQHAELLEQRSEPSWVTLEQAREAARQLAGAEAETVHRYLAQQAGPQGWESIARTLALELRYSMSVLSTFHQDEALEDFCWFRDGTEVLVEFDAVVALEVEG